MTHCRIEFIKHVFPILRRPAGSYLSRPVFPLIVGEDYD